MKGILCVSGSEQRYVFQALIFLLLLLLSLSYWYHICDCVDHSLISFPNFVLLSNGVVFFQGVHSSLDGCPGKTWGPDEKRINKLVFIGRNLDEAALRKGFKGCLV